MDLLQTAADCLLSAALGTPIHRADYTHSSANKGWMPHTWRKGSLNFVRQGYSKDSKVTLNPPIARSWGSWVEVAFSIAAGSGAALGLYKVLPENRRRSVMTAAAVLFAGANAISWVTDPIGNMYLKRTELTIVRPFLQWFSLVSSVCAISQISKAGWAPQASRSEIAKSLSTCLVAAGPLFPVGITLINKLTEKPYQPAP